MIILAAWPICILLLIAAGYAWHAGRPQKPSNVLSFADAKARREQAQRIGEIDPKSIHNRGF